MATQMRIRYSKSFTIMLLLGMLLTYQVYNIYNNMDVILRPTNIKLIGRENGETTNQTHNESVMRTPARPCQINLSFVKIHRTGSGSWHNMLVRFALSHGLFVALPHCNSNPQNYGIFPEPARLEYLNKKPPHENFSHYNIFFDHAVFDRETQLQYMPQDTAFFTQIRHPLYQAQSALQHFHGLNPKKVSKYFAEYLQQEQEGLTPVSYVSCFKPEKQKFSILKNFQAFSLGYEKALENNQTDFRLFLQSLDKKLNAVTILEDLDASLVLLKRKFGWTFKDILYIHTHKVGSQKEESAQIAELHNHSSSLDFILYDHFIAKHKKEIVDAGTDFQEELSEFKDIIDHFSNMCIQMCKDNKNINTSSVPAIRDMLHQGEELPPGKFHDGFSILYSDCVILEAREVINKKTLKLHQYPGVCRFPDQAREVGLSQKDCDINSHILPGYHLNDFKLKIDKCMSSRF